MDWNLSGFLWLAGGLAAFLVCLPMLLGMLGRTRSATRAIQSVEACEPASEQEEYLFYCRQLRAVGFEPLGVIEETGYFLGYHYIKRIRYRVFADRQRGVYASIYRLFPGDEVRVSLSSLLADGWFVQTGSLECLGGTGEKYYRWGITTRVVAEQLEAHLQRLRSWWEAGDALAPIELTALAKRISEVNQPRGGSWFSPEAWIPLCLAVFLLGGLAALGWIIPPWRHILVPGGLLVGSLVYRPLMNILLRWATQDLRRENVEKQQPSAGLPLNSSALATAMPRQQDAMQAERSGPRHNESGCIRAGAGDAPQR